MLCCLNEISYKKNNLQPHYPQKQEMKLPCIANKQIIRLEITVNDANIVQCF